MSAPRRPAVIAGLLALSLLAGCAVGERPTLVEDVAVEAAAGDPATDAVLGRLAIVDDAAFTATYEITNNFGGLTRSATVVQSGDGRRSITIGDVRFLIDGSQTSTCRLDTGTCSDTIDDAAVSDLQVTHQFYGRSTANRLRTAARRRIGPTEGYTATIGNATATCVGVPVDGGTTVFCALDEGPLASYQGRDVLITLTAVESTVDETAFERP
jgi:hypothetical protein